jgi:signal transduction histidine kinase
MPSFDENIIVSMPFNIIDHGDKIFLSYEKKYALISLHKIENILVFSFVFSLFLILLVVWILFKKQVGIWEHTKEVLEMKKTFLSTMSHELRTPLGSILNLTQHLMLSSKISDDEVKMLGGIENASEHLLSMINNLLQLSKLESNAMPVNKEIVNIYAVIEELIEIVEPLIDEKELTLVKHMSQQKIEIESDVNLLKRIIMNLLSNAIKFTSNGSITIILEQKSNKIILKVIDTGIGIKKEKQEELFSEFYQAHMDSHNIKHSTGLGLALSQKVAKLIDAEISIESKGEGKGVGATLTISLS